MDESIIRVIIPSVPTLISSINFWLVLTDCFLPGCSQDIATPNSSLL